VYTKNNSNARAFCVEYEVQSIDDTGEKEDAVLEEP
jgi:hypothetical protein